MPDRQFKVAAAQLTSTDDVETNLAVCADLVARAADQGASMVVLPECFAYLSRREEQKLAVAEVIDADAPGPILAATRDLAANSGVWLIGGGMAERKPGEDDPTKVFNTLVMFDPSGTLVATYRKIHLFDVDIPGGARLKESDSTYAGHDLRVVDTPQAKVGLSICYDLRFPELYRRLAEDGAEVAVVPSAFTAHTGAAHWHLLLRARAVENQLFVVAPGQVGRHNEKRESYGHSLIIDPWGTILAEQVEGTGLALAEIDLAALEKTRREMPCLEHRRLDRSRPGTSS
jgi:predicted amidohydrolase